MGGWGVVECALLYHTIHNYLSAWLIRAWLVLFVCLLLGIFTRFWTIVFALLNLLVNKQWAQRVSTDTHTHTYTLLSWCHSVNVCSSQIAKLISTANIAVNLLNWNQFVCLLQAASSMSNETRHNYANFEVALTRIRSRKPQRRVNRARAKLSENCVKDESRKRGEASRRYNKLKLKLKLLYQKATNLCICNKK